jgi:hypothetical protein
MACQLHPFAPVELMLDELVLCVPNNLPTACITVQHRLNTRLHLCTVLQAATCSSGTRSVIPARVPAMTAEICFTYALIMTT